MKRAVLVLTALLLFIGIAPLSAEHKPPLATLELEDGDSIVFLGDSITHQCLYTQYVEDYFYTRFPKMRLELHNAGVGGAKAWDALQRFERDVAAYKPKYVTVLLGMNDGTYRPYDEQTFQTYRSDMTRLVERLVDSGATPILMTPTMYDSRAARLRKREQPPERLELYNSVLAYYGAWLREIAVEGGHGFVDMYSPLNNHTLEARKTDPEFTLIPDAVHPGPSGQLVMAFAILEDLSLPRPVSNIRIMLGGNEPRAQTAGGEISDLEADAEGVSFTWHAQSLPWVVPEEAETGAKMLRLGHRMSREALEIHGLARGTYELTIDGEPVGRYTNVQLERHVELQSNAKTPQYRQAFRVAELNKQRNAGPVRALRGEWSRFQQATRLEAQLKANPENEALAKRAAEARARLEGMEDRIADHEAAAKEIEDQIFAANQPQPRRYALERVK